MILYLLFPALVLGSVEFQPANITEEVGTTQTFNVSTNDSTSAKSNNVTAISYQDEMTRLEDVLQSNETLDVITEDNESFQDEENKFSAQHCNLTAVKFYSYFCRKGFEEEMSIIGPVRWCILEDIIRPYNEMTICLEYLNHELSCYFPNTQSQEFFLHIHSTYFQNCTNDELLQDDAPYGVVIVLTLIPVSVIPLLVYLVVWKSKVQAESC